MQYFHSTYIVAGIISNIEITKNIEKDVYKLYANSIPFYIKKFEYPLEFGIWECSAINPMWMMRDKYRF